MVTEFRQLRAYQAARQLNRKVWEARDRIASESKGTWWQLDRSAGSVMDNIAEGFGRATRKDFANFLRYSTGSANEVQSQLDRCLDRGLVTAEQARKIENDCKSVLLKIEGLSKSLERPPPSPAPNTLREPPPPPYGIDELPPKFYRDDE